jgi:hypothetical protein
MSMTKSDYELIARLVNSYRDLDPQMADDMTWRFIGAFEKAYPNFKPDIFKKACGIKETPKASSLDEIVETFEATWQKFQQQLQDN